ncbi:MAG: choice-of-anchor A family protein [Lachnospiraceae bacterium]|nr:choice-of-anchor A family protein [Lachnospiraceae bacterium]
MGEFGLFAFGEMRAKSHQHSNVLANAVLRDPSETYGTTYISSEFTIRTYIRESGSSFVNYIRTMPEKQDRDQLMKIGYNADTLIVGTGLDVSKRGNEYYLGNAKIESSGNVIENSASEEYINLSKLQKSFGYYSGQLAEMEDSETQNTLQTQNGRTISTTKSSGSAVINLKASDFNTGWADTVTINTAGAALVINVDLAGRSSFELPRIVTRINGSPVGSNLQNNQTYEWLYQDAGNNRVLWNFYDSSQTDGNYRGSILFDSEFVAGTILAPYASVTTSTGINGMVIAENAYLNGECHRINPCDSFPAPKPINEADFALIKTYAGEDLTSMEESERDALLGDTRFTLYAANGSTVIAGPKALSWNGTEQRAEVLFPDVNCGTSADVYYYKLKETQAPAGYVKSDVDVDCKVERDPKTGELKAYYKRSTDDDSAYSEDFPQFENVKKAEINPQIVVPGSNVYSGDAKKAMLTPQSNPGKGEVTYQYLKKNSNGEYEPVDSLTNAGEYRIIATVAETNTHLGGTATLDYTIVKAPNGLRMVDSTESVIRGHTINLADNFANADGPVTYEIFANDHGCTVDENGIFYADGEVGTVSVIVKALGDENHRPADARTIKVTVNDKAMITPLVTLDDWTYGDENTPTPVVTGNPGNGAVTYTYEKKNDDGTYTQVDEPKEAGTYRITANIAETDDYNGAKATDEFVIFKADITPSVSLDDWTYGDENVPTPVVAGNPGEGTVTYTYEKKNDAGEYEPVDEPKDAGEYRVTATIPETANYNGGTASDTFVIEVADNGLKLNENGDEESVVRGKTIDLSDNFTDADGPVSYEIDGESLGCTIDEDGKLTAGNTPGTITIKVTAAGDENHEPKTVEIQVTVNDKQPITPSVTLDDWTYGDENVPTPAITGNDGNGKVSYSFEKKDGDTYVPVDKPEDAGEYRITITIAESENYNGGTAQTTFTINKADIEPEVEIDNWTYGEEAEEPTLTEGSNPGNGEVTITYEKKDEDGYYYPVAGPKDAGEYRVTVTIDETDNYNGGSAETTFTIDKAENSATIDENELIETVKRGGHTVELGGKVQNPDGEVSYSIISEDDLGCTIDPDTGKFTSGETTGTVQVRVSVAGDENHEPAEFTIYVQVNPKSTVALQVEDLDKTYDGKAVEPVITGIPEDETANVTYIKINEDGTETNLTEAPKDAGKYQVIAEFAETKDYEACTVTKDFTIAQKDVTVTAKDAGKEYGAEEPGYGADVEGLVEGESEDLISYTFSREEGEDVGEYELVPTGEQSQGNYNVTFEPAKFTITAAEDPAEISTEGKENTVTVNTLEDDDHSIALAQFVDGNEGEVTFSIADEDKDKAEIVDGKLVPKDEEGTVTVNVTIADSKNHTGKTGTIEIVITPKEECTPSVSVDDYTYNENAPEPEISGVPEGETPIVEYRKVGDDRYTTTAPTDAGDYEVRVTVPETADHKEGQATAEFTIERAKVTVFAVDESKTFGGEDPALQAAVAGLVNEHDRIVYECNREAGEEAGTYKITPSGEAVQGNYDVEYVEGTFTIKKAKDPAVVTPEESVKKGNTISLADLVKDNVGDVSFAIEGDNLGCSLDGDSFTAGTTEGTVTIVVTIEESDNHLGRTEYITVTVTPKDTFEPEVTMDGWTYGETKNEPSLKDNVSNGDVEYLYWPVGEEEKATDEIPTNAGTYVVCAKIAETAAYAAATATSTFTISRAPVTVTAKDYEKDFGEDDPETMEADVSGLVNNDDASVIVYTVTRTGDENAGEYKTKAVGDTEQGNYEVTYEDGTFKINKTEDPAKIDTEDNDDKNVIVNTLDTDDHSVDLTQFVEDAEGDVTFAIDPEDTTGARIEDGKFIPGDEPGDVKVIVTVAESDNHTGTTETITIHVLPKDSGTLDVTIKDFTYNNTAAEPEVTGVPEGETATIEYKKAGEDTYTTTAPKDAGEYTVRVTLPETADHEEAVVTKTFTINRAKVTVTAKDYEKTYGDADETMEAEVTGLIGDDTVSYEVNRESGEDAGSYTITPSGDAVQGNYDVTYENGTYTINRKTNPGEISSVGKESEVVVNQLEDDDHFVDLSQYVSDAEGKVTYEIDPDGTTVTDAKIVDGKLVPGKETGLVKVKITIDGSPNYTDVTGSVNIQVISKKACNPAIEIEDFTYNNKAAEPTVTGVPEGETATIEYCKAGEETFTTTAPKDAGDYIVRVIVPETADHDRGVATAEFTINRAKATVTAKDAEKNYGDEDPAFSAEVTGLAEGDSVGVISYTFKREQGEDAGEYEIMPKGDAVQGNYDVAYEPATLTIKKAKDPAVVDTNGGVVKINENPTDDNKINLNTLVEGAEGDVSFTIDPDGTTATGATIDEKGNLIPGSTPGEVKVQVVIEESDNHTGKTEYITIKVTEKDTETLAVTQDDATYGGEVSKPSFTPPTDTGKTTITYSGTLTDGTDVEIPDGKMPTEAGTYIVTVICETPDAIYVGKAELVIGKAVPPVGTISADEVHNDHDIAKANVRRSDTTIPGKLSVTETTLSEGKQTYHWTFVPEDTNNYETVKGTVEITMTEHDWSAWEIVKPATEEEPGLMRRVCKICGEIENETIPKLEKKTKEDPKEDPKDDPVTYTPDGSGKETWEKGSEKELPIVIHRSSDDDKLRENFDGIEVDGKKLTEGKDYTIDATGKITLKPEYLQTLPTGEISMKVLFTDGEATVKVEITQKNNPDSPKTGDLAFLSMWMVLLAAATVFLIAKKRKEEAEEGYQA